MSTVYDESQQIPRMRKKPKNTNKLIKSIWSDSFQKELMISDFINNYNHNMLYVNLADQMRAAYTSKRRSSLIWRPLFHYLLDTAVINSFLIRRFLKRQKEEKDKRRIRYEFWLTVTLKLMKSTSQKEILIDP